MRRPWKAIGRHRNSFCRTLLFRYNDGKGVKNIMDDNVRRCQYCNVTVKPKALRCPTCGSLIGRKREKTIPKGSDDLPVQGDVIEQVEENREEGAMPVDSSADMTLSEMRECIEETQDNFVEDTKLRITHVGLFLFGLTVFVPVLGQLTSASIGVIRLFSKNQHKRRLGKAYLFNAFLFFVFWFIVLYFVNEYLGLIEF